MASNSDLTHQPPPFDASTVDSASYVNPRPRHDSNALLMLPAPLAVNRPLMSSTSSVGMSRSSEDNYNSDTGSGSNLRLIPSPPSNEHHSESYDSGNGQRLLSPTSPYDRNNNYGRRVPSPQPPPEAQNPFRSYAASPTAYEDHSVPVSPEYDTSIPQSGRGVRLTDAGPVPGPEGVRRVSRSAARRPTSQVPAQNRYSRNSTAFNLPPGAAPPQPNFGGGL